VGPNVLRGRATASTLGAMVGLAAKLERRVWQEVGTVVERRNRELVVRTETGTLRAERAVSCLVEPEIDDDVLITGVGSQCYVLAILERPSGAPVRLSADGDLCVALEHGAFEVDAPGGIHLASKQGVSVAAKQVDISSVAGRFAIGSLTMFGTLLESRLEKLEVVVGGIDAVIERVVERVKRSYRFVEETDQVEAEHVDYAANKTMSLRAENALITAQELVKVDGSQIHVG
jgi:hypothetical protein